mgnify:CR=1
MMSKEIRLPVMDPEIKLTPTMKPIGKFTVLSIIKLTFAFLLLFCIPINKIKNKLVLKISKENNLLNGNDIF